MTYFGDAEQTALNKLAVGTKVLREKWTDVSTNILGNIIVIYVTIAQTSVI
jgi:hypothetical protein